MVLLFIAGCKTNPYKADISDIDIEEIEIKRYGKALFEMDRSDVGGELVRMADDFRFFLGDNYRDTLGIIQINEFINDPVNRMVAGECLGQYPSLAELEASFTEAFRYHRYHYPEKPVPQVYTYISGLNYESPAAYYDSVMIIALDLYLGEDFEPYRQVGLPQYRIKRMNRQSILPDCFRHMAATAHIEPGRLNTLLDRMVYHGKILFFVDNMLPDTPDEVKIGFTPEQLEWCRQNESNIWSFIINNELLYSTDYHKINSLIQDGPFTAAFGNESPAMTGRWLGWQIVRNYAKENPGLSLQQIMDDPDSQGVLQNSGYKPKRS